MRKRTVGVVLLAGLAISGGGAFTGGNSFQNTSNVAGYASNSVTGATVTDIDYTLHSTDKSKVTSIAFTASEDVSSKVTILTLTSSGVTVGSPVECTEAWTAPHLDAAGLVTTASYTTITCALDAAGVPLSSFNATGLTVHQ